MFEAKLSDGPEKDRGLNQRPGHRRKHRCHTTRLVSSGDGLLACCLSITNLAKVMKLVNANDSITLKCEDEPTFITIVCQVR